MQPHILQKNVITALQYNEYKVTDGTAEMIKAENFLKDRDQLSRKEITERFRQRTSLNEKYYENGFHFSLNFGKRELLSDEKMARLADRYMAEMGFEDEPYVAYRHHDAGHPHLHIVAVGVRANGSPIHIGRPQFRQSHLLCRALEKEYSLEQPVAARPEQKEEFAADHAQRVIYGEPGLKRAMSDVLNTVVVHYNYTSLDELNAVLRQYNVMANPGKEGSRLREGGGLLYHALDENGKAVGKPLKASSFLLKPTIKNLEEKFEQNQALREASGERVSTAIEWALAGSTPDWKGFENDLERKGISMVINKSMEGNERVFFVDHSSKSSFEGGHLGGAYQLEALRNRCRPAVQPAEDLAEEQVQRQQLHLRL
jgi:hypothetical protein